MSLGAIDLLLLLEELMLKEELLIELELIELELLENELLLELEELADEDDILSP